MLSKLNTIPTREEASRILQWAAAQNPGPWEAHSRVVGRAAETIASACKLDGGTAYVLGLLHDVGRYEGVRDRHHVIAGYNLMRDKGYGHVANICLSHSFPIQNIGVYSGKDDCTQEENALIERFLATAEYDDYDRLIQLCDSMCLAEGVCLLDVRLMDVTRRYGFNSFTLEKWNAVFALKTHFDTLYGGNIYNLFYDEIRAASFR